MLVKIKNIWGCITVCDDKLIIEEVEDLKSHKLYYRIIEGSYDIDKIYMYSENELPDILNKIIFKCNAVIQYNHNLKKHLLFGPHLLKNTAHQLISQYDEDYFKSHHTIDIVKEDNKMKMYCKWLTELLNNIKE